ncbi:hypothetical protein BG005_002862, partial [Podila minutissima]
MEEDVMEVDEGGEEDAEDGEEANDEDGVEDVADHFERVLWDLESKIADHPELFTSCSSLRKTLGLFLYRYCLLDATEIVLENEVQLVEVAFGRIKIFG